MKRRELFLLFFLVAACRATIASPYCEQQNLTINLSHPVKIPALEMAFGGGVDGHDAQEQKEMLSSANVQAMKSAGLKPLSYRLRTELGIEAWHWNPHGSWSDKHHQQGYWTSSTTSTAPIVTSYGYRLPRRGNTLDEANNDGYSHLDDGNLTTFWKSNPYLTSHYTGEPDRNHPQWVLLDFGKPERVNAIRLHWKDPYARSFRVQYAFGGSLYRGNNEAWHDFPHGKITKGTGGDEFLYLGQPTFFGVPKSVQFVRILMTESSGTALKTAKTEKGKGNDRKEVIPAICDCACKFTSTDPFSDPRDAMGYALGEVEVGELKANGHFEDHIVHRPDTQQTLIYVSSTDPWHRACDLDLKTTQPGIDEILNSGLTQNLRTLWAIPILYDTPENAAALAHYLIKKNLKDPSPAPWFELGEEPDGQRVDPKDVAELYAQVAKKIHTVSPSSILGGLSFVTIDEEPHDSTYRYDHRPWLRRFFQQLRKHDEEKDFRFLTFEWYPFDDFQLPAPSLLLHQPERLRKAVTRLRHGGIPPSLPLMISEYGYSVFPAEPEVTLAGALLNTEIPAQFLELGGTTSYLYGYEAGYLECAFGNSWGNLMMFLEPVENSTTEAQSSVTPVLASSSMSLYTADLCSSFLALHPQQRILNRFSEKSGLISLPTYYTAQLITQCWGGAQTGPGELYPVRTSFW